jgi:hypothetical protein
VPIEHRLPTPLIGDFRSKTLKISKDLTRMVRQRRFRGDRHGTCAFAGPRCGGLIDVSKPDPVTIRIFIGYLGRMKFATDGLVALGDSAMRAMLAVATDLAASMR